MSLQEEITIRARKIYWESYKMSIGDHINQPVHKDSLSPMLLNC